MKKLIEIKVNKKYFNKYRLRRIFLLYIPMFLIVVLSEAFFIQTFLERL